jgi:hypothetical protein
VNFSAERLARIAAACDAQPRDLLVAAARLAHAPGAETDVERIGALIRQARAPGAAARAAGALLATPTASFALDDIDHALALIWPAPAP